MRALIAPDGSFELEGDSAEVVAAILQIRDTVTKPIEFKARTRRKGRPKTTEDVVQLNESQMQTWQYLIAHDTEQGLSATDYAKDASIAHPVADNRLRKLVSLGMATKVARGRFRPLQQEN